MPLNSYQAPTDLIQAVKNYQQNLQTDTRYLQIRRIIESPIIILIGLISTMIFFSVISQSLPFVNQFFLIDNIVIGITLSSILWAPLLIGLASVAHKREVGFYETANLYSLFHQVIQNRETVLLTKLEEDPDHIKHPSKKELQELVIHNPDQVLNGPWFSQYFFSRPFQYTIIDTDDYFEFSGKLLVFELQVSPKLDVHELLLSGQDHVIHKNTVLLGKKHNYRQDIQLSKVAGTILNRIKKITRKVSSTNTFGLKITKSKLSLIFSEYIPFPEIDFSEIISCLKELQQAVILWF